MTLTYLHAILPVKTGSASSAARWILDNVNDILLAAGSLDHADLLKKVHGKGLKALTTQALGFRDIAGVRVVSGDFRARIASPNEAFAPQRMDDEWADPKDANVGDPSDAQVFSTTHLGLVRTEWPMEGGKRANGAGGGAAAREFLLLKPKVVLVHTLQEILADFLPGSAMAVTEGV